MAANEPIRFGTMLPAAGIPSSAPTHDYVSLIGARVTLEGSGENSTFEANLPRDAVVLRQVALDDWGPDWLVLRFDDPFEYERSSVEECLVRSRWWGTPIGSEFVPVFVLTDPLHILSTRARWNSTDFDFVDWGRVTIVP